MNRHWLLILFVFFTKFSIAQGDFNQLNDLLRTYLNAGEYRAAIPIAQKAIEAARKQFGENHSNYATSLNNLGVFYLKLGQYDLAEQLFDESAALRLKLLGPLHQDYATSLNNQATLYAERGDYKKAEPIHLRIIEIDSKTIGTNHPDYAQNIHNLAYVYEKLGKYAQAESLYISALEIRKQKPGKESKEYSETLVNLAGLYRLTGEYAKAEPLIEQSLSIIKKTLGEESPAYSRWLNNQANMYKELGQYEKAERNYNQALGILKTKLGENAPDYVITLDNLGALYTMTGLYEKAEDLLVEALRLQRSISGEKNPECSQAVNNLGMFYFTIGQYEKAEILFKEALDLRKISPGEEHPDYAQALNNLATLYIYMEQYDKPESLLLQSQAIIKKFQGTEHPDYVQGLNNLASLYVDRGQYEEAEPLYLEALAIGKRMQGDSSVNYAMALNNLAALYYYQEQYARAEPFLLQSARIRKKNLGETHPDYIQSQYNLGLLYDKMGQYPKAETYMVNNSAAEMKNLENIFRSLSGKEKENYLSRKILLLEANNRHVFRYNKASPLILMNNYNQQLFYKSAALTGTRNMIAAIQNSNDSLTQHAYEHWQLNKSVLAREYSLPAGKRRKDIKKLEQETEQVEKELIRRSATFRLNREGMLINAARIAGALLENEVALEFVRFNVDNKKWTDSIMYAVYLLKKNDSVPVFIPLCEEKQLQQLFDSAGQTATGMAGKFYRGTEIKNKTSGAVLGAELYKLIWQPIEPYLKNIRKIYYAPAGKLYSIAFHALPIDSNKMLLDKYVLQQYTSTRQLLLSEKKLPINGKSRITLFGDPAFSKDSSRKISPKQAVSPATAGLIRPNIKNGRGGTWSSLPGTAEEVRKIKAVFEENKIAVQIYTQEQASEENLKALSGQSPGILHIATHGFFLPPQEKKKQQGLPGTGTVYSLAEDPLLRNGLILSGGNDSWNDQSATAVAEDGIVTAYEISQLNLSNTELVVLSACETALGDVKGSEGVFGLQRAFKMAGVKKMIVSLWQVPDKETAELMTAFYGYWLGGKKIEDAFSRAQTDMRKKYPPYYWAAFVLVE